MVLTSPEKSEAIGYFLYIVHPTPANGGEKCSCLIKQTLDWASILHFWRQNMTDNYNIIYINIIYNLKVTPSTQQQSVDFSWESL